MNAHNQPATESLAVFLRAEIETCGSAVLPSLQYLATKAGVSLRSLTNAAHHLRQTGELDFKRGRSLKIVARKVVAEAPEPTGTDRVCTEMKNAVVSGEIRTGAQMPKLKSVAARFGVSDNTVMKAYRVLEKQGIIYKKGKRWLAGSESRDIRLNGRLFRYHMLVVQEKFGDWQGIIGADRTERFATTFSSEAERLGVRLVLCVADPNDRNNIYHGRLYPSGRESVLDIANQSRDQYLGAFLCSPRYALGLQNWVDTLAPLNRPIVWFDRNPQSEANYPRPRALFRCLIDEDAAERLSTEILGELGHSRIGFRILPQAPSWMETRAEHLRQHATSLSRPLRVVTYRESEASPNNWQSLLRSALAKRIGSADYRLTDRLDPILQAKPAITRAFAPFLIDKKISCILAAYDSDAAQWVQWLMAAGIQMPQHLSLLSFDNYRAFRSLPITTIDFGLSGLGYDAFHAILGDVTVQHDSSRTVRSKPFLVDRGSLGPYMA